MSELDLEALKREYAASDERGDTKFTIDFYDMTIVLERLEQAEQDRVKLRNRLDAMRRQRDGYRNQLRKTEQQVARVRELHPITFYDKWGRTSLEPVGHGGWCSECGRFDGDACRTIRALDGDGRG